MPASNCAAIILAGGRGQRLAPLTNHFPKSAVVFGGPHCLIDYTLGNCIHSGISHIGIISQYMADKLHQHIRKAYSPQMITGRIDLLPPRTRTYKGTADALYQNIDYLQRLSPDCVMILSADHVYRMDYREVLRLHKARQADVTILATSTDSCDASPQRIVDIDPDGRVRRISATREAHDGSGLAAMGVSVIKWPVLREALCNDHLSPHSTHDLQADLLPYLVDGGWQRVFAHRFGGYWRSISCVDSLWQASMDMLHDKHTVPLQSHAWLLHTREEYGGQPILQSGCAVEASVVCGYSFVGGQVSDSVVVNGSIGAGASIKECVIMPYAHVGEGAKLNRVIVGSGAHIGAGTVLDANHPRSDKNTCAMTDGGVTVVTPYAYVKPWPKLAATPAN